MRTDARAGVANCAGTPGSVAVAFGSVTAVHKLCLVWKSRVPGAYQRSRLLAEVVCRVQRTYGHSLLRNIQMDP